MSARTYKSNRHILYSCKYHVVFCPKYRREVLVDGIDTRLKEIIQQVADDLGCEIIELEVIPALACGASVPDHVHILCEVDPRFGVHKFVKRVKGLSSFLLRKQFPTLKSRLPTLWTNSYFISTVGGAPLAVIKQYIENQKSV
jgi:putative transposase